jgi:hypothetical protein
MMKRLIFCIVVDKARPLSHIFVNVARTKRHRSRKQMEEEMRMIELDRRQMLEGLRADRACRPASGALALRQKPPLAGRSTTALLARFATR